MGFEVCFIGGTLAILNITYRGSSSDVAQDIPEALSDDEIRRLAVEVVRSGDLPRLRFPDVEPDAFRYFVVDRFGTSGSMTRIYLRPKVPFG